jgi:hypothetical protein
MSEEFAPEPPMLWRRKKYDESVLRDLDYKNESDLRKGAEIETNRDLDKPVEQLVCDVHEETHYEKRDTLANIAGAQKRMTSMMARVALTNSRVADQMLALTWAIGVMTFVLVAFTFILLCKAH